MTLTSFVRMLLLTGVLPLAACGGLASSEAPTSGVVIAQQGYFFVGGNYVQTKDGQIMTGQMFVQYQIPRERRHALPIVMWHGGGQTGTNFLGTPDGRRGWAEYFADQGYAVYVVDQPARARSGFFTEVYGTTTRPTTQNVSERFTAPETRRLYPQAALHTQWPGSGVPGNPAFDQFFASQVEGIADISVVERLNRDAGVALLDRIGPAILLTHSQSGPFGWAIADARPRLVRAILAVEPNGPPFHENVTIGAPEWFKDGPLARGWGIARAPLTYFPAAPQAEDLRPVRQERSDRQDLVRCWLQPEPARQLPNLQQIPIVIVVSEASYHAPYDHCTSRYLEQAGVRHEFVRLPDVGIRGNGHMMMLEQNNMAIAAWLERWAEEHATPKDDSSR
jgi:pimeloyl-ACP methyl ester carboxylesterase